MILDSHQHFWTLSRGDYDWPNDSVAPIFRDFTPNDLEPFLSENGVAKTIVVQATDSVAETEFLLDLASQHDFIAGVVGWVDLSAADAIQTIDRLRRHPALVGLRPMLQGIEDTNWILQPSVAPSLTHMAETNLCFDALVQPRHLSAIATLAQRHPTLRIVIDHIAKPMMADGQLPDPDWVAGMKTLAGCQNVFCKLSGMVTEAGAAWTPAEITPFAEVVLNAFGPERLMFGSDWPVVNLASDYGTWMSFVQKFIAPLSEVEKTSILHDTAHHFYQLPA